MVKKGKVEDISFAEPLIEGVIVDRKNRFLVDVDIGGEIHRCHCPCTGKIGFFEPKGRPCLLSKGKENPKRKTKYTMEAISLDLPSKEHKAWIGVNQNAANRYVEHYLLNGGLKEMVGEFSHLKREVALGNSKIDFLMDDRVFLEVKTPIWRIDLPLPDHIVQRDNGEFDSYERLMKHLNSFSSLMQPRQRAILLVCFMYDHPGMKVNTEKLRTSKLGRMFNRCTQMERWQINLKFTPRGIRLIKFFSLETD